MPSIIPKYWGVGAFWTQFPLAAIQLAELGAPPLDPTIPLFTEFIDTSEPFDKRAIFLALLVNPCPPAIPGPLIKNPNLSL